MWPLTAGLEGEMPGAQERGQPLGARNGARIILLKGTSPGKPFSVSELQNHQIANLCCLKPLVYDNLVPATKGDESHSVGFSFLNV